MSEAEEPVLHPIAFRISGVPVAQARIVRRSESWALVRPGVDELACCCPVEALNRYLRRPKTTRCSCAPAPVPDAPPTNSRRFEE